MTSRASVEKDTAALCNALTRDYQYVCQDYVKSGGRCLHNCPHVHPLDLEEHTAIVKAQKRGGVRSPQGKS